MARGGAHMPHDLTVDLDLDGIALRLGRITLHRITHANADAVRAQLQAAPNAAEVVEEFDRSYLPTVDAEGRPTLIGFWATLDDELAGLSLLGVSSWHDRRGFTGADTLPHMRGRGVAPGSKPHLFHLGFALLGLNRIETGCWVSNTSSKRSIEKTAGFVFEGVLREYGRNAAGQFEDEYRWAILRRDWERLYAGQSVAVLRG